MRPLRQTGFSLIELIVASLGLEDAECLAVMGQIHLSAGGFSVADETLRRALRAATLKDQRHTFELDLKKREAELRATAPRR